MQLGRAESEHGGPCIKAKPKASTADRLYIQQAEPKAIALRKRASQNRALFRKLSERRSRSASMSKQREKGKIKREELFSARRMVSDSWLWG